MEEVSGLMRQYAWRKLPWSNVLYETGTALFLWGIFGTLSSEKLWYWFDFRLWAWWLFAGVVIAVFLVTRRVGKKVKVVGILVFGLMLLVRVDFDFCTYLDGSTVGVRPGEGKIFDYQLYLPKGFHDLGGKRPLIVFLHGVGEVGIDVSKLPHWNLAGYVEEDFPFIVVAPVTPTRGWKPERVVAFVDELLNQINSRLNIDPNRVYLTGFSMGGFGTFATACEYPNRFAAILPVAGYGDPEKAEALQGVPTWAFHGNADTCVDYRSTARMIERMRELKHPNVKFTTLKGYGHGVVEATYSRPELYRWLLKQKRDSSEQQ